MHAPNLNWFESFLTLGASTKAFLKFRLSLWDWNVLKFEKSNARFGCGFEGLVNCLLLSQLFCILLNLAMPTEL